MSELEGVLLFLFSLVKIFAEGFIILDGVKLINNLIYLINSFLGVLFDLFAVDIEHLTRVLRLIKVVIVEGFHGFDDTWEIDQRGQKHCLIQPQPKKSLCLIEINNLKRDLWLLVTFLPLLLFLFLLLFFLIFFLFLFV